MNNFMIHFLHNEDGAITVDWVVLTAAVVALGVTAIASARDGVDTLTANIKTGVEATKVTGAN